MPQNVSANSGLSSSGAVWHIVEIQALATSSWCAAPCREPFLIGNVPSAYFLALLHVLLPNTASTCRSLSPMCTRSGALAWAAGAYMDDVGGPPGWRLCVGTCITTSRQHARSDLPAAGTHDHSPLQTEGGSVSWGCHLSFVP